MKKDRDGRRQFHLDVIAGLLLFVLAACFSASLLAAALGFETASAVLGQMILSAYGLCSMLVPAFLFIAGAMCFLHKWDEKAAVRLVTACVPFFTMVATESTCRSICALGMDSFTGAKISITVALGLMLVVIEYLGAGIIGDRMAIRNKVSANNEDAISSESTANTKVASNENSSQKSFRGAQAVKDGLDEVDEGILASETAKAVAPASDVAKAATPASEPTKAVENGTKQSTVSEDAMASATADSGKLRDADMDKTTVIHDASALTVAAVGTVASAAVTASPSEPTHSSDPAQKTAEVTPLSTSKDIRSSSLNDKADEEEVLLQAGGAVITEEEYNALTSDSSMPDIAVSDYPDEDAVAEQSKESHDELKADELKEISWDNLGTKDEKKNDSEVAPVICTTDSTVSASEPLVNVPVSASESLVNASAMNSDIASSSDAALDADFFDIDMNDPDLDEDNISSDTEGEVAPDDAAVTVKEDASTTALSNSEVASTTIGADHPPVTPPAPIFLYDEDDCDSLIREHSIAKQSTADVFAQMDADIRRSLGIPAASTDNGSIRPDGLLTNHGNIDCEVDQQAVQDIATAEETHSPDLPHTVLLSTALQERASNVKQDYDNAPYDNASVPAVDSVAPVSDASADCADGNGETDRIDDTEHIDDTDRIDDMNDTDDIVDNDMMSNASIDDTLSEADLPLIEVDGADCAKQPAGDDDATIVAPIDETAEGVPAAHSETAPVTVLDDAALDDVIAAPGAAIAAALSSASDALPPAIETGASTPVVPAPVVSAPIPLAEHSAPAAPRAPYNVPTSLLTEYADDEYWVIDAGTQRASATLKETLGEFHIQAEVVGIRKGPVVTMFELLPAPGVKLSKIVALQDNIALRLAASSVRIVAPIPGKKAVGIEIPNRKRSIVGFREIIEQDLPECKSMAVPVILGKDILGHPQIIDLVKTPHLLIAGATGAGKSVCVNSIILSILYKRSPQDVKLILIDPKVVELKLYNDIPHLLVPVITETKKALQALQWALCEMERRYSMLDRMGCREIASYNKKIIEKNIAAEKMPYIIIIIDEFADLMATSGKELESTVARLAAMSRAVGIHLALATQRPSIDVITGLIKANIPSRIAFMVASKTDSRIIIDQVGAEKLLGKGDMLYASAVDPYPTRIQGTFVSDQEVENVVDYIKQYDSPDYIEDEVFVSDDDDSVSDPSVFDGEDPLYDEALQIVVQAGKASASYIQRRLKIGYNRAARLVEDMETRGIVGPANGSKPRELVHLP